MTSDPQSIPPNHEPSGKPARLSEAAQAFLDAWLSFSEQIMSNQSPEPWHTLTGQQWLKRISVLVVPLKDALLAAAPVVAAVPSEAEVDAAIAELEVAVDLRDGRAKCGMIPKEWARLEAARVKLREMIRGKQP